jgi:uncharacterized membrane protein
MESLVLFLLLLAFAGIWLVVTVVRSAFRIRSLEDQVRLLREEIFQSRPREAAPETTRSETARQSDELAVATNGIEVRAMPDQGVTTGAVPPLVAQAETPSREPDRIESAEPLSQPSPPAPERNPINWERFMGVKLFAWIGGFALFLAVVFFVKYSFDHNLVPPAMRVALGILVGIGLVMGGIVMRQREYRVTAQTLCATGVLILYAATFACRSPYHLLAPGPVFGLMVLVTLAAFILAVRQEALVVAILGLAGGFLTPPLLSTGEDRPLVLFSYVALLVAGLVAVAFKRRWHFLILLAAIGTVLTQIGWGASFFAADKVFLAMAIFLGFDLLYLLAFVIGVYLEQTNPWLSAASLGLPLVTLGFVFYLLGFPELGMRPGVIFAFVLGADICLLIQAYRRPELHPAHLAAGVAVFLLSAVWTMEHLVPALLPWALGWYLVFAVLHAGFPLLLHSAHPEIKPAVWGHLFPLLALLLVVLPLARDLPVSWLTWACVGGLDLVAIGLAVLTVSIMAMAGSLILTLIIIGEWIIKIPTETPGIPEIMAVVGGFALFFFLLSLVAGRQIAARMSAPTPSFGPSSVPDWLTRATLPYLSADGATQIAALSTVFPFLLLIMVSVRLPLRDPSPVFGLALGLVLLLLGLVAARRAWLLVPVGLGSVLALEAIWHAARFDPNHARILLFWYGLIGAVFFLYPFLLRQRTESSGLPWACSALAVPLHFPLVYQAVSVSYPNGYMGLLPALLAIPMGLGLRYVWRHWAATSPHRQSVLAWYGGSTLFFITLIFPIQFEREWLTIGWALEGAALLWLFHRVPHPGLPMTGVGLLVSAFVRLALNPAVLEYHPRGDWPILNWYLYSYGIVTACLMSGARLLARPRHLVWRWNIPPVLYGLGTVLAFLLVNIEIADYFSAGTSRTFQFSGNFARDMTYSLAWALFGLGLLVVGMARRLTAPRFAGLGLLSITLLKLFFHDLSQLGQLYRIGAFIGVAIILILASFLYQRFLAEPGRRGKSD